ncbi:MAG: type II secretion system protein M [Xanthomonadaceae bacterium]|nr:type II secretion system protein M [Xanthomonadaceae bacterium]
MQNIKSWFYGLQRRERWMVAGGAVIVVVTVLYLFVLEPFYAAVAAQEQRVAKKQADLAWMRSVAGDVIALSQNAPMAVVAPANESLVVLVDRTARECGLSSALTGQTPNGATGIRVRLERAEFDKLVLCLANLQQGHAVSIESASIDRTSEPGFVNASLVLNRAAG